MKLDEREEVVRLMESGQLDLGGERSGSVTLPEKYARLSRGGRVLFHITEDGIHVFFFTFVGVLDNFSGFAYLAKDSESAIGIFVPDRDLRGIVKKKNHWYWAAST